MATKVPSATANGNVVVLFMPFTCQNDPTDARKRILGRGFHAIEDHHGYLYPYVYQSNVPGAQIAKCGHFIQHAPSNELWEVAPDGNTRTTEKARTAYEKRQGIAILNPINIHLFLFESGTHLIAYELSVHEWVQDASKDSIKPLRDPLVVAATLQGISKLDPPVDPSGSLSQGNRIRRYEELGSEGQTLMQKANDFLTRIGLSNLRILEHASHTHRKAGVYVHVQADEPIANMEDGTCSAGLLQASTTEQIRNASLYYLANMWNYATFPYDGTSDTEPQRFSPSPGIEWAISYEALACITYRHNNESSSKSHTSRDKFLIGTFERNVRSSYLFMYALLLHQKYTYLAQLSSLNAKTAQNDDDLRIILRDSQRRLEKFRLDYVYARVSDTPQYQMLYEKVREAFALDALETDIREPLNELARLERVEEKREAEREKQKDADRESKLNRTMNLVAALSIVSAFTDGKEAIKTMLELVCKDQHVVSCITTISTFVYFFLLVGVFIGVYRALKDANTDGGSESE